MPPPRDVLLLGTVSVGRDPSCEISANDPALSRHHAEFLETAGGILVRDLRSQNGIKVNSVVVREALLLAKPSWAELLRETQQPAMPPRA